jgi:hypothetical protein
MRGVPDHSDEQPSVPASVPVPVCPPAFTPKEPLPEALAALGREVLELVPRKQWGSLDAYRQAAHDLSRMLKVGGVRIKPKNLYYVALRVKWIADNTTMETA